MIETRFGIKMKMPYINVCVGSHAPQFIRWITSTSSSTKLFVGGLSYDTNETILKDAFEAHGEVIEVKVICDHTSSESKLYGFVRFTAETAASKALKEMHGQLLDGRTIRVEYAHKK